MDGATDHLSEGNQMTTIAQKIDGTRLETVESAGWQI